MKTNVQSQIKIPKSGFKRSKLPWSHDVNTTFGWGEIQPTECKLIIPGSKTVERRKGLVRFAPMVAPTFGRVRYKSFSQFVPIEDVYPNFGSMMTQEPKSTAVMTKVAKGLLSAPLAHISSWAFMGARATLYFAAQTDDGHTIAENAVAGKYVTYYRNRPGESSAQWRERFNKIQNLTSADGNFFAEEADTFYGSSNGLLPNMDLVRIKLHALGGVYASIFPSDCSIRLSARLMEDMCPVARDYEPGVANGLLEVKSYQKEVTFDSADFVLEGHVGSGDDAEYFALAFEFSDFGKRIRKIIQGLGYQINLTSPLELSVIPFFAEYKAYFDCFQPQLYQGYETTWAMKYIKWCENYFVENGLVQGSFAPHFYPLQKDDLRSFLNYSGHALLMPFMLLELADEWYIERPDYFGAHLERLAVSPVADRDGFLSVNSLGQIKDGANIDVNFDYDSNTGLPDTQIEKKSISRGSGANLPYINQLQHGFVDAKLLERITRWINKYSILGRAYDKIMRAFGLGKYLDAIDSKFIGNTDKMLTISDVVSYAATADASLGEYGGKGLEFFEESKQVFENDVFGYWITLACIVPEAGYTQGIDLTLACIKKTDMYQADFDAIGMEATEKEQFVTAQAIANDDGEHLFKHTFGFIPRLSKWKVHKNLVNGDFNRHGLRSVYLPYTLDKQLNVNDYDVRASKYERVGNNLTYNFARLEKSKKDYQTPCAGIWTRTPTKYKWLGHFDRIFLTDSARGSDELTDESLSTFVGFSDFTRDNFMFHAISDMTCYAPVKPIEESYGVDQNDESPNQVGVEYVIKA